MKKVAVLTAKHVVRLFPKRLREFVKRSSTLTMMYRRSLSAYGFDDWDEAVAFRKCLQKQREEIQSLPLDSNFKLDLVVLVSTESVQYLENTLTSIQDLEQPFKRCIFVFSDDMDQEQMAKVDRLKDEFPNVEVYLNSAVGEDFNDPGFIIQSGDMLHPNIIKALANNIEPDADIAYVDCDRWNKHGVKRLPEFYPDWNPDLQLTTAYVNSGVWLKSLDKFLLAEHFRPISDFLAEWLSCRYLEHSPDVIQHIPLLLNSRPMKLEYIFRKPSLPFMEKLRKVANVNFVEKHQVLSLKWKTQTNPLVSLIIPTYNGKELVKDCIESILCLTNYDNYEILLIDNNSDDEEALAYFDELAKHPKITLIKYPHPFNYSAINNFAATRANGEVIGLVNNDIEVIEPDWLTHMVSQVLRQDIGCVGAKLLYSDDTIQHAGVVMGYGGGAGHAHKHFPVEHSGYLNRLVATQNFSAVTAACLLVTKQDFDEVGGLNEKDLAVAFNDVDFCLRVLQTGKRNLYCAEAVLYHHESVSRGDDESGEKAERFAREVDYLKTRWREYIEHDPAYNPNLTLRHENFSIRID